MVKKKLAMMLFSGPYGSQYADQMCLVGEKALEMGYDVDIFLYGEGVHAQLDGQSPKAFFNVGEALNRMKEKGANIVSCVRCSQARGYVEGDFEEGADRFPSEKATDAVRIYSLYGFTDMLNSADKVITFGSG
jgi:tRNA 2-thiouridine synthesizing protein D